MLTKTQELILQRLQSSPEEKPSIRQLARSLKKSYTLAYNNIQVLLQKGIIESHKVPPAQIIQIKEDAPTNTLIEIERKRTEIFLEKYNWIKLYLRDVLRTAEPFFIMLVFGSYAKGAQTKLSDLDLLIIVPKKEEIKAMESAILHYTPVKRGVIIVDTQAFIEMIKNPKTLNVGNEAVKYHIILYGADQFYKIIKQ